MKINKLFTLAAIAALCFASCKTDDPVTPEPKPEPKPEPEVKSEECKLIKLVAVTSAGEIEASLFSNEKVAEIDYLGDHFEGLKAATLQVEVSPKATTDLEEGKVYDLTTEKVEFTVTAEDGVHKATWKIEAVEAEVVLSCDLVDQNVPGKFGINKNSPTGASVAFCGVDKIATINGEVYDFDANKVGDLNMEGVPEGAVIFNINNDVNGVVICNFAFNENGIPAITNDDAKSSGSYGYTFAWKDGFDKAPTLVYTNANNELNNRGNSFGYMNCGGDVNGDFLLCAIFGGRSATQSHHVWEFHNGDFSKPKWYNFKTDYSGADSNCGQTISPASGNINGTFFIGDSMGDNKGYHVYTRQGVENKGEDVALQGTTKTTVPGVQSAGIPEGNAQYGNYSTGNIKAFMLNGTPYVITASTGWPEVYITIQSNDPADEENHYLLKTQYFSASEIIPSAAYVYDAANDKGQVLLLGGTIVIARYEIKREIV
ncbi:MAG: hypothetical protein MR722_01870 [Bacteroidales bacterium]|nr:hypothetical protein [Bacteroidales bacterium]